MPAVEVGEAGVEIQTGRSVKKWVGLCLTVVISALMASLVDDYFWRAITFIMILLFIDPLVRYRFGPR
jgi:hypothetical protein